MSNQSHVVFLVVLGYISTSLGYQKHHFASMPQHMHQLTKADWFRLCTVAFIIYIFMVCPQDVNLRQATCKLLWCYREHVLQPVARYAFRAIFVHMRSVEQIL